KTGATALNATVDWSTANGSAVAPGDYTAVAATTLTFLPGETSKTVTVLVNGDITVEPAETFAVTLSMPAGATISDDTGVGTIENDDVSFAVNDVSALEGHSGTTDFTFTVTKTGSVATNRTVHIDTAAILGGAVEGSGPTCTAGDDYLANS